MGVGVGAEVVLGVEPPPQAASRSVAPTTTSRQNQLDVLRRGRRVFFDFMFPSFSQDIRQLPSCTANRRRLYTGTSSPARCAILVPGATPDCCLFVLNS
jgi:hypothetical protein